ncbi:MAG: NADH-quinone oxidoreductase subunit M [Acidobacteria bacterium]|nr:NADH-quinone oxidoreductase subunit M [Acidobacteriota bacterium]MCA1611138.1 NADH-quinone oxidoreductase subunit M [Acidobacteriota bacterium]
MNTLQQLPILSIIAYIPLAGALIIMFLIPKEKTGAIKAFATAVAALDLAVSLPLWFSFDRAKAGYQFVERIPWIPSLGVDYHFGIDGITLLLILLTTFIGVIAIYSSFSAIAERQKEYYILLLLLQTFMIGTFCCLDFFLFYVFWEIMLVPMYFLIGVWGGQRRLYAAIKFFLYTLAGSVLMLLGIIALYFYNTTGFLGYKGLGHAATFSVPKLTAVAAAMPPELQVWLFFAFFFGFAIKVPMFPFHTWLPDAHTEAPTAGSVILAAVLLKMGTYGFVRFSLPMFPEAVKTPWVIGTMVFLAIVGIVYGAMVTLVQKDMKKLIAYSSVSHLGFVMLGIFALNMAGVQGGVLQMINHGISTGALFLLVGVVYERRHTRMIAEYGGLARQMPIYATYFLIMALSSMGLPLLNGFIGEFSILQGAFAKNFWWALFACTGIVLGAAYLLWLYQRVFFGELSNPANAKLPDLSFREQLTLAPLVVLALWIGLYPKPFFDVLRVPSENIVRSVGGATMTPPAYAGAPGTGIPAAGDLAPAAPVPAVR